MSQRQTQDGLAMFWRDPRAGTTVSNMLALQLRSGRKVLCRQARKPETGPPLRFGRCGTQLAAPHCSLHIAYRLNKFAKFCGIGGKRMIRTRHILIQREVLLDETSTQYSRTDCGGCS